MLKNKGITGDHVVFSFVSRRIQPLQRRKHPAFRYEGVKDPTRHTPEAMSRAEVVKRCCKVLDHFDNALVLPALFSAVNPPEKTWVRVRKHYRVLVGKPFDILMNPLFCRRIIRHGAACLRLQKMPLILVAVRSVKQLLDLCCRGKHIASTVASKNLIFFIKSN